MLIECPECKKQISDKANVYINCGFPLKNVNAGSICTINGEDLDMVVGKQGDKG